MASLRILASFAALTAAAGAHGQSLDLSRVPPSINASLPPNILVSLDDSGSMAWGYLPDNQSSIGSGCNYYDPTRNRQYFNPDADYTPPLRADGTSYPNASFTDAPFDGLNPSLGSVNLNNAYRVSHDHRNYEDYAGGWRTSSGTSTSRTFPEGVEERYYSDGQWRYRNPTAFYCSDGSAVLIRDQSPAVQQNFANWFAYYRFRSLSARSALSTAMARLDGGVRVAWQNFNNNTIAASTEIRPLVRPLGGGGEDTSWRTSFYNWLVTPRFTGSTPMRASFHRAGQFFQRTSTNQRNPYWDQGYGRELACRQNFHIMMTDGYWNGSVSAPGVGDYDSEGRGLADGRTLSGPAARVYYNVASGGTAAPNLADLAMYYWARDLRDNLPNVVPSYFGDRSTGVVAGASADDEIYFNPANDPANWQRMVNFMVTFGAGASLPYSPSTITQLRTGARTWPAASSNSATAIDDAWHAAVNSRGQFLSAEDPNELVNALSAIIDNVSRRQGVVGSAGSTAFLRSDAVVYEASYDTGMWGGDIIARRLDPATGEPTNEFAWPAGGASIQLNNRTPSGRRIITNTAATGAASQVNFNWGTLSSAQQAALNRHPVTGSNDGLGEQRLRWIRGERNREQQNGGPLRNRDSVLGPFIGSSMINVAAPRFGYRGRSDFDEGGGAYARFRAANRERSPTLYIGSNDGMLHAFNAATGAERWAFIPNRVFPNLARMTIPEYQFLPFVNNTPIDHDVYFGGRWRTVLVGTLGLGGQGVYAIDITDPESPQVLWEFTDQADPMLGYTYGRPNVVRLSDGTWVAMVPAGYNAEARIDYATRGLPNERPDVHYDEDGDSTGAVFAINIGTGAARRIDVPNARGLATVQAADYELDYKVDFLVAGDLRGDLWRIDLTGLTWSNVASARVDRLFQGETGGGLPLRPITSAPTIFADPSTGKMTVVVGTGKYIENVDRETNIPRQAIYGIRECGPGCARYPIRQSNLVQQTITASADGFLNMSQTNVVPPDRDGWYVQLGNPSLLGGALLGERIIDMSIPVSFASGIVALGSFIPSSDPCAPLGTGAVYVLSAFTGGFPLPGDLNTGGTAYQPGQAVIGGGTAAGVGKLTSRPPDLSAFLDPDGGSMSVMGTKILGVPVRRRSGWREIPLE